MLHCIDAFGVDRTMMGTNWPVDILCATYLERVDAYRAILAEEGFSREDQAKLPSSNAEKLYRI